MNKHKNSSCTFAPLFIEILLLDSDRAWCWPSMFAPFSFLFINDCCFYGKYSKKCNTRFSVLPVMATCVLSSLARDDLQQMQCNL